MAESLLQESVELFWYKKPLRINFQFSYSPTSATLDILIVITNLLVFIIPYLLFPSSTSLYDDDRLFNLIKLIRTVRAIRALRVLKTVSFLKSLQIIVGTLLKSARAMTNIVILMILFLCELGEVRGGFGGRES